MLKYHQCDVIYIKNFDNILNYYLVIYILLTNKNFLKKKLSIILIY